MNRVPTSQPARFELWAEALRTRRMTDRHAGSLGGCPKTPMDHSKTQFRGTHLRLGPSHRSATSTILAHAPGYRTRPELTD